MIENQDLNEEELKTNLKKCYDELKNIGAQKIHEKTHIPKTQCEDLLNGDFEKLNKVQLIGFISILEREYSLDLNELRIEAIEFFKDKDDIYEDEDSKVFVTPKKVKSYKSLYIIAAVVIFLVLIFQLSSENDEKEPKIDSKKIQQVASKISPKENQTEEKEISKEVQKVQEQKVEKPKETKNVVELKIIPNSKLWVGYIDLDTGKKYQKIVPKSEELELNSGTHWLLSLGHGDVTISIGGELNRFRDPKNIRLEYKDGELKKINYKEFLSLNKGKEW